MTEFPERLQHSVAALERDQARLLIALSSHQKPGEAAPMLADFGLALEDAGETDKSKDGRRMESVNHTARRFWVRSVHGRPVSEEQIAAMREKLGDQLDWIGPVYRVADRQDRNAMLCPLPNVLLIAESRGETLNSRAMPAAIKEVSSDGVEIIEDRNKSKFLPGFRYFVIRNPENINAYTLLDRLRESNPALAGKVRFENMPMIVPASVIPNDTLFGQQWGMVQISAPDAWDISTGVGGTVICVLDEGCDLTHPDLTIDPSNGINLGTMSGDGSPTGNHGTACAGIAAASFNNAAGVAGVAGSCTVLPAAVDAWTDVEIAAGITYARTQGAQVISMSFGWDLWDPAIIDPAILDAFNAGLVMCVATHNHDSTVTYPATNPLVMACGASDMVDNRKSPTSPDGECWGSNFGPEVSVVAPGVVIPSTDIQGTDGYNVDGSGGNWACVNYPSFGDAAGDYVTVFDGTSAATPHVAGLAALIISAYPALTNVEVRHLIERTAEKVGAVPYADTPGYDSGTWNQEMGYGRINCFRALDEADVMIRDWSGDDGTEPSTPPSGNFWSFSDIVVRITDDDVFVPTDPGQSKFLERGQDNHLYIRVTNNGPREARNVSVAARLTPFVGTQFVYPHDWTAVDATHLSPAPVTASFATIPAGGEEIAHFLISAAQVEILHSEAWHPCLVASVNADNDYAFTTAPLTGVPIVTRRNNLAQRNLSVIDVLSGATAVFSFLAAHPLNRETVMELRIDRGRFPKSMQLHLVLDDVPDVFPAVDLQVAPGKTDLDDSARGMEFLETTRIRTRFGCCDGVLTLARGSRFDCIPDNRIGKVEVEGGEVVLVDGRRHVALREQVVTVRLEKLPGQYVPLAIRGTVPHESKSGERLSLIVSQRDAFGQTVGGATAIFSIR